MCINIKTNNILNKNLKYKEINMVNRNYVIKKDKNANYPESFEGFSYTRGPDRNRRIFRSANELNVTFPLRESSTKENNTNTGKKKKNGEPNLLKYSITDDCDDVINKTDNHNGFSSPRRHSSFAKKTKNPSDGSHHYTRSSGGTGSPNTNLSPIAENDIADSFEMFSEYGSGIASSIGSDRFRRIQGSNVSELIPNYNTGHKFDTTKYFSNSTDDKKFAAKGTHPDSLYRVNLNGGDPGSGLLARCYRLLRWPAALLATCVALALFIYYVMPDSAESELLGSNATVWEAGLAGKFRHRPAQQRRPSDDDYYRQPVDPDTTTDYPADSDDSNTTEIDFLGAAIQKNFQEILQEEIEDANIQNMAHPVYPEHVTPEVQYGNERSYPGTARVPKVFEPKMSTTEFTLRTPYRDSKGDLALYVNEDVSTEATQETTNYKLKPTTDGPVRYSLPHGMKANFTSGHSKLFGISIEDAERYQTTPNSLYNTRVSPTLPAMAGHYNNFSLSTTTRRSDIDDVFSCRSISLDACRRVLRYDLTAGPVLPLTINDTELEKLTQEFHEIMESPCSRRLDQFLCNLMQTECTSSGMTVKKPCKKLCKAVLNDCKNIPSPNSLLSKLFDCSLYPEDNCIDLKEPCMDDEMSCQDGTCFHVSKKCNDVKECANGYDESECSGCSSSQYRCAQSGCIPKRWLCDGYADCPNGEDEEDCRAEKEGFFPHPRQYPSANPSKPPKLPGWISKPLKGVLDARHDILREGAESVISPQVQLPKNALQKPTKVDKTRVNDASRKGEYDNRELLMMSDSTNRAPPVFKAYGNKPVAEPVDKLVPAMAHAVGDILDNLEKMADADKWWEQNPDDEMLDGEFVNSQIASERRSGTAHASPCPVGELRCVDGRCIMFSQLCDGHVDCSDHADEDNCSV